MQFYVYVWTHLQTGRQYVGKGFGDRAHVHYKRSDLQTYIARAMRAHGLEEFSLEIAEIGLSNEKALELEQWFISVLNTKTPQGFNLTDGGEGMGGFKHSEEARKKMSQSRVGRPSPFKGKSRPKLSEAKRNMSQEERNLHSRIMKEIWDRRRSEGRTGRGGRAPVR